MKEENRQRKIQQRVKRKIGKIEELLSNGATRSTKNEFLEKFMICETACKAIISDYNQGKKKKTADRDIKLQIQIIEAAIKYAGYSIKKETLTAIFGSTEKRNEKSCKKLRDGIVHSMSAEDIQEVVNRHTLLLSEMQIFLDCIHNAPTAQTTKIPKTKTKKPVKKLPEPAVA